MKSTDRFLHVLFKTFISAPSLLILLISVLAGGLGHLWGVGVLIFLFAELSLLVFHLNNVSYLNKLFGGEDGSNAQLNDKEIEEMLEGMDFDTRQRLRYIWQIERDLLTETKEKDVPGYAKEHLNGIGAQLNPLLYRAMKIGKRRQDIMQYLTTTDERAIKRSCDVLRQRIASENDAVTRSQYEQALKAREAELEAWKGIDQSLQRIDSQLENLEATLSSWKAKVIRIKSSDEAGASMVSEGLNLELKNLNENIDSLDTSIREVLSSDSSLRQER
jgi:hypothetical protein